MAILYNFVTLGMEHLFPEFNNIKSVTLQRWQKDEIIRQIFSSFEGDFSAITLKFKNFIKYEYVFPLQVSEETKKEINEIVYNIALGLYFECVTQGLFVKSETRIEYFPYFLENNSEYTCVLRLDAPFTTNSSA